jgi:hypothetical protein
MWLFGTDSHVHEAWVPRAREHRAFSVEVSTRLLLAAVIMPAR